MAIKEMWFKKDDVNRNELYKLKKGDKLACKQGEDGICACGEPIVCEELYICKECLDRYKE